MAEMLKALQDIDNITKQNGFLEDQLS